MTLRELNRTLLLRQMLLERKRVPVHRAVARLVALQAQYAPSPYVALWSRVGGFRKQHLTGAFADGSIVKAATLRTTLHVATRDDYPALAAAYIATQRAQAERLGAGTLRAAVPDRALDNAELAELAQHALGTEDRWQVAFAARGLPFVRTAPVGPWPHTKPSPVVLWREPLPDAAGAVGHVVRAYLAAYGPASRDDVQQFTGFRLGDIDAALEGARESDGLFDAPRARRAAADTPAPVRFLPAFDSIILAHRDRSRIVPPEYLDAVFNKKNLTTKNTFTVDGFVAGAWRIERRKLTVEPFAPLPLRARRDVDAEGDRLLAWYLAD